MDNISSGSTTEIRGSRLGCRMGSLWPLRWLVNTHTLVTSDPVPAVVGMAMTGTQPGTVLVPPRWYGVGSSSPETASTPTPLAESMALPPPNPIRPSQRSARYRCTPLVRVMSMGSAAMLSHTTPSSPAADSVASNCFMPSLLDMILSVTISGRWNPRALAWEPTVPSEPMPNTMFVGMLNMNWSPLPYVLIA